jgi:filamentous hemagglutinin
MNKIFKVIKNKNALESKKVVSELASANVASNDERASLDGTDKLADSLKQFIKQSLCVMISSSLIFQSSYADIIADTNAPTNQQATILNTASGATQVNIQTPTNAGISVNQYSEFNTAENGTILNNSRVNVQTQSAGWVEGNPWLAGGEAKAIVNQVNSNDPSMLTGTIEVAGKRADVIIANPSGISVDGASILNASGTTLTTGKVNIGGGAIQSYDVEQGTIRIEGGGLNDSGSDYTHILSRATEINANIHANNLKIVAGANEISADTSTITKKTVSTPAPSVAIDTKALGGMYAGSITLVGTESGVGVNNAGVVNANNFTLSADGKLTNSGVIAVNQKSDIAVNTLENSNAITSNENIEITADTLNNSGTISATRELKSTSDTLTNSGTMQAARLDITSDTLTNNGGTIAQAGSNSLEIHTHKLTNTNGALLGSHEEEPLVLDESDTTTTDSGATVTTGQSEVSSDSSSSTSDPLAPGSIMVSGELLNDGGEMSGASVALGVSYTLQNSTDALINVANLEHTGSILHNDNAKIVASSFSALSLVSFTNLGSTIEGSNLQFDATAFDNTEGTIIADQVDIRADSIVNQSGHIQSESTLALTGGSLDNTEGTLHSSQNTLLNLTGDITNTNGSISATTTLDVKAYDVSNDAGVIQADQFVNIEATSLHNAGDILSGGDMSVLLESESINEGTLSAAGDLIVETTAEFTNSAVMSAVGTLGFMGSTLVNGANGEIMGENVDIKTSTLTNRGAINSDSLTWLKADTLNNIGTGAIYGDTIIIDANTLLNTNESVDGITKSAVIAARELLNIGAQNITNSEGAELLSLGVLNIGGSIDEFGNVTGKAAILDNLSARIESGGDMYLGANELNNFNMHLETEEVADPTVTEVLIKKRNTDKWYPLSECYGITQGFEDNYCGINDKIARFQELGGIVVTNGVTYPGKFPFGPSSNFTPEEQA